MGYLSATWGAFKARIQRRPKPSAIPTVAFSVAIILVLYKTLTSLLPYISFDSLSLVLNLLTASLLVLWARRCGLSWKTLGLLPSRGPSALKWAIVGCAIGLPTLLAVAFPGYFASIVTVGQWRDMSWSTLTYQTLMRIPLGTALFEEIAFRGVLYGLWSTSLGPRRAGVASSVVFGMWHVTPMLNLFHGSPLLNTHFLLLVGVAGGVVSTFVGGLIFIWLRHRTGSVYGAALAHWAIDGLTTLASFLSSQGK